MFIISILIDKMDKTIENELVYLNFLLNNLCRFSEDVILDDYIKILNNLFSNIQNNIDIQVDIVHDINDCFNNVNKLLTFNDWNNLHSYERKIHQLLVDTNKIIYKMTKISALRSIDEQILNITNLF